MLEITFYANKGLNDDSSITESGQMDERCASQIKMKEKRLSGHENVEEVKPVKESLRGKRKKTAKC